MTAPDDPDRTDAMFKALAAQPRRRILDLLATSTGAYDERCCGPYDVCACRFAEELGLTASTISHHMRVLIEAGLVSSEKRGLWVFYRLRPEGVRAVLDALGPLRDAIPDCCVPSGLTEAHAGGETKTGRGHEA